PELWGTGLAAATGGADRVMTAAALLGSLRAMGVAIRSEDGRLIVEAPAGLITAEVGRGLGGKKPELVRALHLEHKHLVDSTLREGQNEIAKLLANAYRRYSAIQRVSEDQPGNSGNDELAKSDISSVHGVVP